jgi:hypothetical protein
MPDINKKLLTAKYIIENSFSSLGRAYARKISYVKLENMTKKPGAASQLITKWLGTFVNDHKTTTFTEENGTKEYSFDLDSLARIYKGIASSNTAEQVYFDDADYYTLSDEITDEIAKIAVDPSHGDYTMKLDIDIDKTIEDKYTSSGTYTLSWGHELALRDLASKKISGNGLFTKTNGISDLPETVSDRLFSSSISSYLTSAYYMKDGSNPYETGEDGKQTLKANAVEVKFLTPATSENGSDLSNYYFFDSTTNAYYIVVVEEYRYTASNLKSVDYKHVTYQGTEESEQTIIGVDNDMARIALELSSSTSYSTEAILKVLEEYEITTNIHDQAFYDYMKENYSKLFD